MNTLLQDIRYGLRMIGKAPGFSIVTILVLAVAIGGTTAMFSIINALVFRPLPVKGPEQLVRLYNKENKPEGIYRSFSYEDFTAYREKNTIFTDLLAFSMAMVGVNEGELTRRSFAAMVSANYFDTLGVRPAKGRGFLPEEEKPRSATPVAVISHSYWQRTGANPEIIGTTVRLNARPVEIVGVAPEHFTGTTAMFAPDFWLPLGMYELLANDFMNEKKQDLSDRNLHALMLVGRLKPGLTAKAAEAQL
jgi:macrolide transport system ATP-binding/permease protein